MEKLDKQKIIAVVLVISLIAALCGAVSLLYNSIDMFLHNIIDSESDRTGYYIKWQEPYAIITLIAFVPAAIGTGAGIAYFAVKKASAKKLCSGLVAFSALALLVLVIAAIYKNISNEASYFKNEQHPYGVYGRNAYALYSAVMSALLQQLVYSVIIAAAIFVSYKIDAKAAVKAAASETDEDEDDDEDDYDYDYDEDDDDNDD